jgi:cytoskeletal protein CcmA (bactofilin family)
MFGKEKAKSPAPTGGMSTISNGTSIEGDITSENDLRIDGHISGHIRCKAKVVIGEMAVVDGDIEAGNADIFGMVNGNVTTTELLCLKSNCVINGNISVGRLDIEANATFNGKCTMNVPKQPSTQQYSHQPQAQEQVQEEYVSPVQATVPEEPQVKKQPVVIGEEEDVVQSTLL